MENKEKSIKENNLRVLAKLAEGDNLATSSVEDSWFPSRGIFDREKGRMVATKQTTKQTTKPARHLRLVKND